MPRLRDRTVLDEGIVDMPMIWQTDAFALATGYDEAAGRYIGLWTPEDKGAAPAATDSLLLVRPDVAAKQRDARATAELAGTPSSPSRERAQPSTSSPTPKPPSVFTASSRPASTASRRSTPTRSRWTSRTSPTRSSPTSRDDGTELVVRIEIEATNTDRLRREPRSAPSPRTPRPSSSTSRASRRASQE